MWGYLPLSELKGLSEARMQASVLRSAGAIPKWKVSEFLSFLLYRIDVSAFFLSIPFFVFAGGETTRCSLLHQRVCSCLPILRLSEVLIELGLLT